MRALNIQEEGEEIIKKDDEATASDAFRDMQEATRTSIEAAGETRLANIEYQHGWPDAARELIELRASFENADAAALDRDRTLVGPRYDFRLTLV